MQETVHIQVFYFTPLSHTFCLNGPILFSKRIERSEHDYRRLYDITRCDQSVLKLHQLYICAIAAVECYNCRYEIR